MCCLALDAGGAGVHSPVGRGQAGLWASSCASAGEGSGGAAPGKEQVFAAASWAGSLAGSPSRGAAPLIQAETPTVMTPGSPSLAGPGALYPDLPRPRPGTGRAASLSAPARPRQHGPRETGRAGGVGCRAAPACPSLGLELQELLDGQAPGLRLPRPGSRHTRHTCCG